MKTKQKLNSFLYNHLWLKRIADYAIPFLGSALSALIFAFGMTVFLQPDTIGVDATTLVSGGSSGLAQVLRTIVEFIAKGKIKNQMLVYNIFYFAINLPLLIMAWLKIGRRFGFFTVLNVGFVVLFNALFSIEGTAVTEGLRKISMTVLDEGGGSLARAFFAGTCTGLSSAIAYKTESSTGGLDIITYYVSNKKSTTTGKYNLFFNIFVIASFALVTAISQKDHASAIVGILYSTIYLITVMLVIDLINIRNKKAQIQIITSNADLPKLLLANIPHGATVSEAKGVYTEDKKLIIYMVVSTSEIKRSVSVIRELDPNSFINVTSLVNVYGNFHIKPIK